MTFRSRITEVNGRRARALISHRGADKATGEAIALAILEAVPPCSYDIHALPCEACQAARVAAFCARVARETAGLQ